MGPTNITAVLAKGMRPALLLGSVLLATGCASGAGAGYTLVEKRVRPSHFRFVPIVAQVDPGPGGWQAACLYLRLAHGDGRALICKVGVEMPMQTAEAGPISVSRAQRVAAKCANAAADLAFSTATPTTPLGIACSGFISTYDVTLRRILTGSRVSSSCRDEAESLIAP